MNLDLSWRDIYVGNLSSAATDEELENVFGEYGEILSIYNQYQRGFAFIRYEDPQAVLSILHKPVITMFGAPLRVDHAFKRRVPKEVVSGLLRERESKQRFSDRNEKTLVEYEVSDEYLQKQKNRQAAREQKIKELESLGCISKSFDFDEELPSEPSEPPKELHDIIGEEAMPVITKRTAKDQNTGTFTYNEPTRGVEVEFQGLGNGVCYSVGGVKKPRFEKASFEEDEEGPFIDFEELDTSLSLPSKELIPQIAAFFSNNGVLHNVEQSEAKPPQGVKTATSSVPAGRGRGRGRGQ